jgi:Mn-dependent DtxR family transcriptional regulator
MYTKDKNTRITLRLNEEQFVFVKTVADALGVSPSEYIRMMLNLAMVGAKKLERDGARRENEQTCCDDIV